MQVEKLPIKREWDFYDDDDVVITFSMTDSGVAISLTGATPFAQIRTTPDANTGTLIAQGTCSVASDIITTTFAKADLADLVGSTIYGDLRLRTALNKSITLLSFSALINSTVSREV